MEMLRRKNYTKNSFFFIFLLHRLELINSNDPEMYDIKVRCGEWDTEGESEEFDHQERNAKNILIHPGFKPNELYNDVGIIILESNFDLDQHIDTICLPDLVTFIYFTK